MVVGDVMGGMDLGSMMDTAMDAMGNMDLGSMMDEATDAMTAAGGDSAGMMDTAKHYPAYW